MDRVESYLSSFERGLDALPEAKVKGEVLDDQIQWLSQLNQEVDPRLRDAVKKAQPFGHTAEWVPEVLINAMTLQVRDNYETDEAFLAQVYQRQREIFRRPLYRALLMLMSPTLITMGADKRWQTYRQGTDLKIEKWRREGTMRVTVGVLTHPAWLHTPLIIRALGTMLCAAIDGAGGNNSSVEVVESDAVHARYELRYEG